MMNFVAASDSARKKLSVADHILTQTYPLVKDPKLLLAVLQNLYEAVDASVAALIDFEVSAKRIPPVGADSESQLVAFRQHLVARYGVPKELLRFIGELRETMQEHKAAPVEFARRGEFVICDEGYKVRTLTVEQLKRHVQQTRAFITFMEEQVNRNDAILARRG